MKFSAINYHIIQYFLLSYHIYIKQKEINIRLIKIKYSDFSLTSVIINFPTINNKL